MRKLILMRHAKSDWGNASLSDHDRPLNKRGRRAARQMAKYLRSQAVQADFILASSAKRVQETLKLMREREQWCPDVEVLTESSLYLASPREIARHINSLHDDWHAVLIVGHNPGISELASSLAGGGIEMPTAAVAIFHSSADVWRDSLAKASWQLDAFLKPRELDV